MSEYDVDFSEQCPFSSRSANVSRYTQKSQSKGLRRLLQFFEKKKTTTGMFVSTGADFSPARFLNMPHVFLNAGGSATMKHPN